MPLRAMFFDFDGLICDTERAARRSWQELHTGLGLVFDDLMWTTMTGRSDGHTVMLTELSRRLDRRLTTDETAWRLRRKHELSDAEPLRAGVTELLDEADQRGIATAVVSSSELSWVDGHLRRLGVRERFGAMVTGDEVPRHKPAPDLYLRALERVGVDAASVVAFEDSVLGVRAARAAGLRCVAVPSSVGSRDGLQAADAVLPSLSAYRLGDLPPLTGERRTT